VGMAPRASFGTASVDPDSLIDLVILLLAQLGGHAQLFEQQALDGSVIHASHALLVQCECLCTSGNRSEPMIWTYHEWEAVRTDKRGADAFVAIPMHYMYRTSCTTPQLPCMEHHPDRGEGHWLSWQDIDVR